MVNYFGHLEPHCQTYINLHSYSYIITVCYANCYAHAHAATIHVPSEYSLCDYQSINGSDQYGGCPADRVQITAVVNSVPNIYCLSSIGVISDDVAMVNDLARPDWARDLITFHKQSQEATRMTLRFNNNVSTANMLITVYTFSHVEAEYSQHVFLNAGNSKSNESDILLLPGMGHLPFWCTLVHVQ